MHGKLEPRAATGTLTQVLICMWVIGVLTCSQTYPLIPFPLTFLIPLESGKDTDGCYQDWGAGGVSCDGAGGGLFLMRMRPI